MPQACAKTMPQVCAKTRDNRERRYFIGGSDARIIMGGAKEAVGHGVRAKRSKSGAVSFDLLEVEGRHAAL